MSDSIGSLALLLSADASEFTRGINGARNAILGMASVGKDLEGLERQIGKVNAASIAENITKAAQLKIDQAQAQERYNRLLDEEVNRLAPMLKMEQERAAILKTIADEAERSKKAAAVATEASRPENVSRQVGLDLQAERAQGDLRRASATERVKQTTGGDLGGMAETFFGGGKGKADLLGSLQEAGGGSALKGLGAVTEGAGGATELIGGLAAGVAELVDPITAVVGAATLAVVAFNALEDTLVKFVGKSNPAMVERHTRAWDDLQAVIGSRMEPALALLTDGVRLVGDVLQTALPSRGEMREIFGPLQEVFQELRGPIGDVASSFRDIGVSAARGAAEVIRAFANGVNKIEQTRREANQTIRDTIGDTGARLVSAATFGLFGGEGTSQLRSSQNMAAGPAQYVGLEDLNKNALLKTFESLGASGGDDVPKKQLDKLSDILDELRKKAGDDAMSIFSAPIAGIWAGRRMANSGT